MAGIESCSQKPEGFGVHGLGLEITSLRDVSGVGNPFLAGKLDSVGRALGVM